jgi:hypothetical protein
MLPALNAAEAKVSVLKKINVFIFKVCIAVMKKYDNPQFMC